MKILIVEDEVRISRLLRMYLERESYQVDVADNGNDGLNQALQQEYDLIILDVLMPGKDGYEVLGELRKSKSTPAIMLSARCSEEDIERGMALGVSEFIAKPFSPSEVVLRVKKLLK